MTTAFQLRMRYTCGGTTYTAISPECEHFSLDIQNNADSLRVTLQPKAPVSFEEFTITFPYSYRRDSRIFPNGYQSWTDSREYMPKERMSHLYLIGKSYVMGSSLKLTGDYDFKKYPNGHGIFHGYSYGYVRNGDSFELIGSLSERNGFTIINFNCKSNTVVLEKELEGITISDTYPVFDMIFARGSHDEVFGRYFTAMQIPKPRVTRSTGYTTWYNYYPNINEKIVADDMEALAKLDEKIDFFQIDDGYQTSVGDWLSVDPEKFPNGMKKVADTIHAKGLKAGIWLAPVSANCKSKIAQEHPDWMIQDKNGKPLKCGMNWGGFYGLDISKKEAADYVRHVFDVVLNEWGFDMVKLDFLYSACVVPMYNKTRGQLMCECMDFLRDCVGDKLILGCGVPLAPAFGKVDYCRVGADMGLGWGRNMYFYSTHREDVSTEHNVNNSIFRRGLDGRAFVNDPDVILLRDYNIKMDASRRELIAKINKIFGNLLFISDNIGRYNDQQMKAFKEALKNSEIQVVSAQYIDKYHIEIVYTMDGETRRLTFHVRNGEWKETVLA